MLLISFIPMYWYSKVYFRYAGKSLSTLPKEVLVDLFKYLTPHSYCNQMSNVTMGARKVAQKDFLNLASTCKLVQSVALEKGQRGLSGLDPAELAGNSAQTADQSEETSELRAIPDEAQGRGKSLHPPGRLGASASGG